MTLKDLPIGKTAMIRTVGGEGALRQHFWTWAASSEGGSDDSQIRADGRPDRSPGTLTTS